MFGKGYWSTHYRTNNELKTEMYLMILAEEAGMPAGRELDVVTEGLLFDCC
jgi:hypothetical protein